MQINNAKVNLYNGMHKAGSFVNTLKEQKSTGSAPSFTGVIDDVGDISKEALRRARAEYGKEFFEKYGKKASIFTKKGIKEFFVGLKDRSARFFKENFTEGTNVRYENKSLILKELKVNFGNTFENCMQDIDDYNIMVSSVKYGPVRDKLHTMLKTVRGKKDRFVYITNETDDSITFHKDPFLKNLCLGFKEFTVGQILDLGVSIRNFSRKLSAKFGKSSVIAPTGKPIGVINELLDRRIAENKARDAFYRLSGVFEKTNNGIENIGKGVVKKMLKADYENAKLGVIKENIYNLAKESINQASKKVGNYNTKNERAWNRLGTGFVSATFAATDFYNISMYQNNDPDKANKSGRKRFWQDMRRQGLTAGITFIVLGALQSSVNSSILAAALSLGGITLISEVLSRKIGGIPLRPLSPADAKKLAEKREKKNAEKAENETKENDKNEDKQIKTQPAASQEALRLFDDKSGTFGMFTNKYKQNNLQAPPAFTSNSNISNVQNGGYNTLLKAADKNGVFNKFAYALNFAGGENTNGSTASSNKETKQKNKSSVFEKIAKGALGILGASVVVAALRTKNVLGIDDLIKSTSKSFNNAIDKFSSKRLIMPKDDVDGFLNYLEKNNFLEQSKILRDKLDLNGAAGKLSGESPLVQKYIPKRELNPEGFYYDLGYVESKGKKAFATIITYPIKAIGNLFSGANTVVRRLLGAGPKDKGPEKFKRRTASEFMEKYAQKYRDANIKGEMYAFKREIENAFSRQFSEANSKNKNTTVAMVSRFLITLISGYFFVNDYRNEVLIESKGEDVERANATMKERVGHKISNFFLNTMFMHLFNSTFENIYLGSVGGATAVAMATELTNETSVRASICTPVTKMTREELIQYENERLNDDGFMGKYYRTFMKLTGKKPLSEKAKN